MSSQASNNLLHYTLNSGLDDEQIYQHARKWVIAELQNIAYSEFLPSVLGSVGFRTFSEFSLWKW